jgi:predicted transcriptional regulator
MVSVMPPSKLDKYLSVLEALVLGPQKLDSIAYKAKMECNSLKHRLDFLVSNGLVEERYLRGKRMVYVINERGLSVFKTLRALKYLEKLKKTLPIIMEAQEITSVLTEHSRELK